MENLKGWTVLVLAAVGIIGLLAQTPVVTQTFGLTLEREDFLATDGATVFNTSVSTRGATFALVFKNGLLQTQEQNPSTCALACNDYSSTPASNKQVVVFLKPLAVGDKISLMYWR